MLYYDGLEQLEQVAAQQQALQQSMMAQQLGMGNAAKPQGPAPMPDVVGGSTPQAPPVAGIAG